ncbi:MAG: fatty acid hydroxylase [Frankiales bacterium]|jgi:hypothetical protein|nr:fatty acid hydroxylase [Frankiales bacterium]
MAAETRHLTTLTSAYGEFVRHPTPRLLGAVLLVLMVGRGLWAGWSWADAVVVAVLVGLQPFTEWVIHVVVLHCPANGGLRDRAAGASHRRHHEDPRDLRYQFIHPYAVYGALALAAALVLGLRTPAAVTGVLTATVLTLVYEWVHFLIHTDYAPRHEPYRRLHRAHRLHHFRNERYWLGVTARTGDRVLGTNPRKQDVPVSPTARTALAAR